MSPPENASGPVASEVRTRKTKAGQTVSATIQAAWDSLGPPGKRRASGAGQPGGRANFNASERAGTSILTRVPAPEQLRWQGGCALCSRTLRRN
jgi:hypothetical protein